MQPNLEGVRRPPARQHQHQQMGLHFDQHEGVPQQAILACEVTAQVQKCSETEARRVSPRAVQESGESPSGSDKSSGHAREPGQGTSSGEIAIQGHSSPGRATSALWWRKSTMLMVVADQRQVAGVPMHLAGQEAADARAAARRSRNNSAPRSWRAAMLNSQREDPRTSDPPHSAPGLPTRNSLGRDLGPFALPATLWACLALASLR